VMEELLYSWWWERYEWIR